MNPSKFAVKWVIPIAVLACGRVYESRCDEAQVQLRLIEHLVQEYQSDLGRLPGSLEDALEHGRGNVKLNDPWGFRVAYTPSGTSFDLRSVGADGTPRTSDDVLPDVQWTTCRRERKEP